MHGSLETPKRGSGPLFLCTHRRHCACVLVCVCLRKWVGAGRALCSRAAIGTKPSSPVPARRPGPRRDTACPTLPHPGMPRAPGPARLPLLQSESAAGLPRPPCMTRPPEILTSPLCSGLPFARRHQPDSVPDRRQGPRGTACSASPEHRNALPASPTGQRALLSRME